MNSHEGVINQPERCDTLNTQQIGKLSHRTSVLNGFGSKWGQAQRSYNVVMNLW
jgi:hypothetical protein